MYVSTDYSIKIIAGGFITISDSVINDILKGILRRQYDGCVNSVGRHPPYCPQDSGRCQRGHDLFFQCFFHTLLLSALPADTDQAGL